jgi:hypothetical protein
MDLFLVDHCITQLLQLLPVECASRGGNL